MDEVSPARYASAVRSLLPFAGTAAIAFAAVPVGTSIAWLEYGIAGGFLLLAGAVAVLAARGLRHGAVPAALVFYVGAALLRDSAGGIASGASALAIVPVFAVALSSASRRDLLLTLAGEALFYLVPIVAVGGAAYPQTQYRATLLTLLVSTIIGGTTQRLVARARGQAGEARRRERMLEQVAAAVHRLLRSGSAREDVCAAAREISEAMVAVLYEPVDGELLCTAGTDPGIAAERIVAVPDGAVAQAFASGRPRLVDSAGPRPGVSRPMWERVGRPEAFLYEPLLRGDAVVGVLAVGWPDRVDADGARCSIVRLLAQEAATVITRADELDTLADEALTDPLTGLPNRRAWDVGLARAIEGGRPLVVAMLDIDHFKQFNDSFGHSAGDLLLKETAAAWRDELRADDLLARIGGEEFGLLLNDCDAPIATEIVARLRGRVSSGATCSAGIAPRRPGEPAARVVDRADAALYEAKAAGRDRARLSGSAPTWAETRSA